MASQRFQPAKSKDKINLDSFRRMISEIKLKRTDTTLDLSQKAKLEHVLAKDPNVGAALGGLTELKKKKKKDKFAREVQEYIVVGKTPSG